MSYFNERPIIGITPLWDDEKDSLWMLPGYVNGIIAAGGLPITLPLTANRDILAQAAALCDGFLFTGGHDVSPAIYGAEAKFNNLACCRERDEMEWILLDMALQADKPLLGICRGIQFLNAALGGTLYQDIPSELDSPLEHHQTPPYDVPIHHVSIETDSPLFALLREKTIPVNSYHHQAVKELAPPLKAMAYAEDGLVEAVYLPEKKYVWAVQWHPEFSHQSDSRSQKILEAFVQSC